MSSIYLIKQTFFIIHGLSGVRRWHCFSLLLYLLQKWNLHLDWKIVIIITFIILLFITWLFLDPYINYSIKNACALSSLCSTFIYTNCDNLWQILYHRTLTKWDTSEIPRTWNSMKISQALWWNVKREPGNPLVSRIVRASSNGIVIARNPIYQAFPRPSSILCTAFHRFSLCHSSRFSKPGRRRHWQLSSPCLGLLQCRVVYVSPVPKTAISDRVDFSPVWCDSYYRPAFLSSFFLLWRR